MTLRIEHEVYTVGYAIPEDGERFRLEYDEGWRTLHFAFPVSLSLPMTRGSWSSHRAHPFFANLLPEGMARQAVCDRLGISFDNDVTLLSALGNDTAGALRFIDEAAEPTEPRPRVPVSQRLMEEWARGAPALPDDDQPLRLSLAGAQHKTTVVRHDEGWALPASAEASTHILKFDSERFRHLSSNEFLTTRFARNLGLDVVEVSLDVSTSPPFLVVERYDRALEGETVVRVHQEDFCQVHGVPPRRKYEAEGGPTLKQVAETLRQASASGASDIQALLRWMIFCAHAGNADGHAKNLSLVYTGHSVRLAPFYDLVCTRAFPRVDARLAFAVGGQRDPDKLQAKQWEGLATDLGVHPRLVWRELERQLDESEAAFASAVEELEAVQPGSPVVAPIERILRKRCRALRAGI